MGASRGMNNIMWRYGLTENRPAATSGRCRGEGLRCVATRRLPSRMSVNMKTDYPEKRGLFMVKTSNRWCVFQCTVNWTRARPKTALIASGAQRSSSFYAAGVRECVAAGVRSSVLPFRMVLLMIQTGVNPNQIRADPLSSFEWFRLFCGRKFAIECLTSFPCSVIQNRTSPAGRTHGSAPYFHRVGFVVLICVSVLTVSCNL